MIRFRSPKKKTAFFAIIAVFFVSLSLRGEPYAWPRVDSDEHKIKFLLWAEKYYPNIFEGMTAHDTDLLHTLELQDRFLKEIATDPRFADFMKGSADRKVIEIAIRKNVPIASATIDAEAFEAARRDAQRGLDLLPRTGNLEHALREQIIHELGFRPGDNPEKAAQRLVNFIDPEKKKDFYKAPVEQKVEMARAGAASNPNSGNLEANIEIMRQLEARDEHMRQLLALATVQEPGKTLSRDQWSARIKGLKATDHATTFAETENLTATLKRLLETTPPGSSDFSEKNWQASLPNIKDAISTHARSLKDARRPAPPPPISEIRIIEVPPPLAILRGCIGGDCASKNLAAYAQSPSTRVFYVDTGKETPAAYFESTVVNVKGAPHLYVFTINGSRLSDEQTETILRGLHKARSELGVEGILLPQQEQLRFNINYDIIRNRVHEIIQGQPKVEIEFQDADLRRELKVRDLINTDTYHSPDKIKTGVVYEPRPLPKSDQFVDVTVKPTKDPVYVDEPISKGRALMLALELDHATVKPTYSPVQLKNLGKKQEHVDYDHNAKRQLIQRILDTAKITPKEFQAAKKVLANEEGLSFEKAVQRFVDHMKPLGYKVDPQFKSTRIDAFYPALLRSPDAFEKKWSEKAVVGTLVLLAEEIAPELVVKSIKEHPELFAKNTRLRNMLLNAFRFENTRLYYPAWRMAEKLGDAGFKLDQMPEVVEKISTELGYDFYHQKAATGALIKLGDERTLEWALDNLVDLAYKSNPFDSELSVLMEEALVRYPTEAPKYVGRKINDPEVKHRLLESSHNCADFWSRFAH